MTYREGQASWWTRAPDFGPHMFESESIPPICSYVLWVFLLGIGRRWRSEMAPECDPTDLKQRHSPRFSSICPDFCANIFCSLSLPRLLSSSAKNAHFLQPPNLSPWRISSRHVRGSTSPPNSSATTSSSASSLLVFLARFPNTSQREGLGEDHRAGVRREFSVTARRAG